MKNVAFLFTGVGSLLSAGGAERFFSDFFEAFPKNDPEFRLFFISDKESVANFQTIGNLKNKDRVLTLNIINNRFKHQLEALQMASFIVRNKIRLVQIPLYNRHYLPLIQAIDKLPSIIRPKLVLTITDSFIPYYYFNDEGRNYNFKAVHEGLFNTVKLDAVISWYQLFNEFVTEHKLIKSQPKLFAITSRYTGKTFDTGVPKKKNIVFAGRLTLAKRPMMFVEAIRILKDRLPQVKDWHFFIYGKGHLEQEVKEKVSAYGLDQLVTVSHALDMTHVFEESTCFVSTQDFENFPSLSMNEAMAAGNAIITRNVGRTELFVKDGVNGILLKRDDENGLADAIGEFIQHPEWHRRMGQESLLLTKEVHTFDNFKKQMESFWQQILMN